MEISNNNIVMLMQHKKTFNYKKENMIFSEVK